MSNLSFQNFSTNPSVYVNWTNSNSSYVRVKWTLSGDVNFANIVGNVTTTENSYTIPGLQVGSQYWVQITPYNNATPPTPGASSQITVNAQPQITRTYTTAIDCSSLTLAWTGVYSQVDISCNRLTDICGITSYYKTFTSLSGNTMYNFSVFGCDISGTKYGIDVSNTTSTRTLVQPPKNPAVTTAATDTSSLTVTFTLPTNYVHYSINYIATATDSSFGTVYTASGTGPSLQIAGLNT